MRVAQECQRYLLQITSEHRDAATGRRGKDGQVSKGAMARDAAGSAVLQSTLIGGCSVD